MIGEVQDIVDHLDILADECDKAVSGQGSVENVMAATRGVKKGLAHLFSAAQSKLQFAGSDKQQKLTSSLSTSMEAVKKATREMEGKVGALSSRK